MSVFTGKQYKGAMRAHRETKRAEAATRQTEFDVTVDAIVAVDGFSRDAARELAALSHALRYGRFTLREDRP